MLRCEDNSIYTGITTDLEKRMKEHFSKDKNCAKYTLRHSAKKLEAVWKSENRVLASKLEYHIKRLSKSTTSTHELIVSVASSNFKILKLASIIYKAIK
jgi:putative endonuclease